MTSWSSFNFALEVPVLAMRGTAGSRINRAFAIATAKRDDRQLYLLDIIRGDDVRIRPLWKRRLDSAEDCKALLASIGAGRIDLQFLGRLTTLFGSDQMDIEIERLITEIQAERLEEAERQAEEKLQHKIVKLYARESTHGQHILELQRMSRDHADWIIRYDRAIERDRLCDWLRWQTNRYLEFLDHAANHGSESLSRILIDEMFATERRIKKEGRSAGGMRPLRMWRGAE